MAKATKAPKETKATKPKKSKAKSVALDAIEDSAPVGFSMADIMDDAIDYIEKKVKISSQDAARFAQRISTGQLALDMFLGGGIVPGGWYTFSGGEQSCKSTLTMSIIASLIKLNYTGTSAVFDYEGSTDAEYVAGQLKTFGVKIDPKTIFGVRDPDNEKKWLIKPRIRYYSPENGTRFFDWMSMLRRRLPKKIVESDGTAWLYFENNKENAKKVAGLYDKKWFSAHNEFKVQATDAHMQALVLVDSYPAMLPDQLDDDDGSNAMAIQARMFSDGIKRFRGGMRSKMMTVVGVNQLRQKPATMFGCLHGDVKVPFVDGRVHTMRDIVNNKIEGEIWSYNEELRTIEPRKIQAWHNNGEVTEQSHWMKIVTRCPETGNGQAFVTVTPNHEVLTDRGWKRADEVLLTDRMVSKYTSVRTGSLASFLNAVAVGDSSMVADSPNSGLLKLQDLNNPEYVQWKLDKLEQFFDFESYSASHGSECYIARSSDFVAYSKHVPDREPWKVKFDDMSFAVYYMDDGCLKTGRANATFSAKRFKGDEQALTNIQEMFASHGFPVNFSVKEGNFWMDLATSDLFFKRVRKYIPKCMQYKLPEVHQGYYEDFDLEGETHVRPVYVEVIRIEEGSSRAFRKRTKYDITVEHNHNYLVGNSSNGVIVHNSPEYEPCGDALKFYCFAANTPIRTNYGTMTAPAIKDLMDSLGEKPKKPVLVETTGGFSDIMRAWPVEEDRIIMEMTTAGKSYIGSDQHRQLVFIQDTTDKGEPALRTEFRTLAQIAEHQDSREIYAVARLSTVEELEDNCGKELPSSFGYVRQFLDNYAHPQTINLVGTYNAFSSVLRVGEDHQIPVIESLSDLGIVGIAQGEQEVLIPGITLGNLRRILKEPAQYVDLRKDMQLRQRSAMIHLAILTVFPELSEFVAVHNMTVEMQETLPDSPAKLRHIYLGDDNSLEEALTQLVAHRSAPHMYDKYEEISRQAAYIEDLLCLDGNSYPITAHARYVRDEKATTTKLWDVTVPDTGTIVTNGMISHNSDVRIRLASRAVPEGWPKLKDAPGIVGEESVTVPGAIDRYRFIAAKTIKNKMGGIPNQQTWMRLWEADGDGKARGFDPVFDTWHYLKTLGLIQGMRKKFRIKDPCPLASDKNMDWDQFRILINGSKEQITEVCKYLGVKPNSLRTWCFKFVQSTKGREMLADSVSRSAKKTDDDE